MLFSEVYGTYYNVLAKLLEKCILYKGTNSNETGNHFAWLGSTPKGCLDLKNYHPKEGFSC